MTREERKSIFEMEAEMQEIHAKIKAGRKLPESERIELLNRLMASFLFKRGALPDHLKKFISH